METVVGPQRATGSGGFGKEVDPTGISLLPATLLPGKDPFPAEAVIHRDPGAGKEKE